MKVVRNEYLLPERVHNKFVGIWFAARICLKRSETDKFRDLQGGGQAWHRTVGSTDLQFFTGRRFNLQKWKNRCTLEYHAPIGALGKIKPCSF